MDLRRLRPLLVALLVAWFCLDMTTPDLPGAFMFDPDQSVEVLGGQRTPIAPIAILPACPVPSCPDVDTPPTQLVPRAAPVRSLAAWTVIRTGARSALAHGVAPSIDAD